MTEHRVGHKKNEAPRFGQLDLAGQTCPRILRDGAPRFPASLKKRLRMRCYDL